MIRRYSILLFALGLSACIGGEPELLPPLAEVEVPVVELRQVPAPRPAPVTLLGQSMEEVRAYLGEPALKRVEVPAEIWRYGDGACGVHLYFYDADGLMRVEHVDTRIGADRDLSEADCLAMLRAAHENPF